MSSCGCLISGYKRFALRCYLHVFEGYEAGGWQHVAQHLRFIMARQTFSLHLLEESVLHFLGLLNGIATLHECRVLAQSGGAGQQTARDTSATVPSAVCWFLYFV